ncbi:hypothetical protein [Bdellovibrio sp. HCB209]|uniref:hypothetical protein n=1 Tax=Bdellovibrio sp. HCB209 TaxID=3394354 RepID=UPI0039B6E6C8
MKHSPSSKDLNSSRSQIIKPRKNEEPPTQRHTPEGPAEEFIQEDLNASKEEPTHRNTSVLKR